MIEEKKEGQKLKEKPNELKFFEELQLEDFQEYEDLFKIECVF